MSQIREITVDDNFTTLLVKNTHHRIYHYRRIVITQFIQDFQQHLHHSLLGTSIQLTQINLITIFMEYLERDFIRIICRKLHLTDVTCINHQVDVQLFSHHALNTCLLRFE